MEAEIALDGQVFRAQLSEGISIARTISVAPTDGLFDNSAVNVQSITYRDGDFVGDMSAGGSCNVNVLKINPHCCGTHTETLLHVMRIDEAPADLTIASVSPTGLQLAFVLTLKTCSPAEARASNERFSECANGEDCLVSAAAISVAISSAKKSLPTQYAAWDAAPKESLSKSLVIRIATDDLAATAAPWSFESAAAPYFTEDAIDFLNNQQVTHLLVEFPSVDRLADGGQLINHHKFWNINRETRDLTQACPSKTITEMIEVSPTMKDGLYLLSFHVPPVRTDAMLSNPVLFKLCHQA